MVRVHSFGLAMMMSKNLALCLLVIYVAVQVQSEESDEVSRQRLLNYLYRNSTLGAFPKKSINEPVKVEVELSLIDIKEVDSKRNEVEIDAWLSLSWNSGIKFAPDLFNNLTGIRMPVSKMWVPDINPMHSKIELQEMVGGRRALLWHDGSIFWLTKVKIRVMCNVINFQLFTNTTCKLRLGSWAHHGNDIMLNEDPLFGVDEYFADSNYQILGVQAERKVKTYSCCPETFPNHQFIFSFRKKLF